MKIKAPLWIKANQKLKPPKGKNGPQKTQKGPKVQSTIERTKVIGKEVDQIRFGVEGVCVLYNDWVNNWGFNPEKVFSMKGVEEYFPEIIAQVKGHVWNIFSDLASTPLPQSYFLKLM